MKMKFGALVVDGRGKIGGHVASKNRAGAYLRTKVTPVNPQSSFQNNVRSQLAALSQGWRSLTAAQRSAWNNAVSDFAKTDIFGDLKTPTGFNLYTRLNSNLNAVQESQITSPPNPSAVPVVDIGALTIDVGVGDASTLALSAGVPSGTSIEIWATPPVSPGVSFVKSEYRLITFEPEDTASPLDIQSEYNARFGVPTVGSKVFAKIKFIDTTTGIASGEQSTSTIVVSTV